MSAKKNNKKIGWMKYLILVLVLLLIVEVVFLIVAEQDAKTAESTTQPISVETTVPQETEKPRVLDDVFQINRIDEYVGIYVEDGTDEAVSGVLMMEITNISEEPVQYASFILDVGGKTAEFAVSVLPAGGTAILLEQKRMKYDEDMDYSEAPLACVNLAGFDKPISLREDQLQIQILDGAANILNISGKEIKGTITLCYKNIANDVYHGGIAYRIRIEGGMKTGELKQIMATHLYQPGSELLFVDIAE